MLERLPNETALQHHRRIIEGKLVDRTLADIDYAELAPYVYGHEYSSDVARRMMYGSRKTLELIDGLVDNTPADDNVLSEIERRRAELFKERQKLRDERTAYNKMLRDQARDEELKEILERQILEGNLPKLEYEPFEEYEGETSLIVSCSDIHYGAQCDNYWNRYNSDICKHMFGKYINEIAKIAKRHNAQDCYVTANGDLISGGQHLSIRLTNQENIMEQVTGVSELLAQFLAELSIIFNRVYFISVAGNHSRLDKKDDALISERLDDLVEWYLAARMANFDNVFIGAGNKIDPTMYLINVRGYDFLGVHGDFEPSITNVTNLQAMVGQPIHAVLMAHRHHCATDSVQGVKIIQSGSFLGTDDYCISKRLFGKPEQIVTVVGDDGVECNYNVDLTIKE